MSRSLETIVVEFLDAKLWIDEVNGAYTLVRKSSAHREYQASLDRAYEDYEIAYNTLVEWVRRPRNNGWRPISEAPTDGTKFLVYSRPCGTNIAHREKDGEWWFQTGCFWFDAPTHFMPLPEPPEDVRPEVMAMLENDITEHAELWAAMANAGAKKEASHA